LQSLAQSRILSSPGKLAPVLRRTPVRRLLETSSRRLDRRNLEKTQAAGTVSGARVYSAELAPQLRITTFRMLWAANTLPTLNWESGMSPNPCLRLAVALPIVVFWAPGGNSQPGRFDGHWTIEAIGSGVACPISKRSVVGVIVGNRVVQVSGLPISGAVGNDGAVVASYHSDMGLSLHADGRVAGITGSGTWRSSPAFCSGTWRARRNDVAHAER
jgi:hypothetical protein